MIVNRSASSGPIVTGAMSWLSLLPQLNPIGGISMEVEGAILREVETPQRIVAPPGIDG